MNVLTFDIEEWFHLLNNPLTKSPKNWSDFESRIERNMDNIFELLEKTNTKATFLVLGWIAEKYPNIIKRIDNLGYEIGTHTHTHQLIFEQGKLNFKNDLEISINTLENLTGKKIRMFRAPSFSITKDSLWAFDILAENGIEIDCSIFPANRLNGGIKEINNNSPFIINYNGIQLKEFPVSYSTFFNSKIVSNGGGYFRFFPEFLINRLIKKSSYNMSYFHPRDFDYYQPRLNNLSMFNYFKSYVGLKNCYNKLEKILNDYEFKDVSHFDELIKWNNVQVIDLQ
jgi:peptidoglycan-N-acetylglucosamine deacetylase